jgi:hypothetical protein
MKRKTYNYFATQLEKSKFEYNPRVVKVIFTQLLLKAATKVWGKDAMNAAEAEMKQLHWGNSFMQNSSIGGTPSCKICGTSYFPSKKGKV